MLRERIRLLLVSPLTAKLDYRFGLWFFLSLLIAVYMAWEPLQNALSHDYVVQDDARQHVFWMQRFIDSELFPHDLLADYFQSVAPPGYTWLYQGFAGLGMEPILLHKLLPLPLMLLSTAYAFGICWQLLRVPFAGFLTALLLNISLWMRDDVVSATPVAFAYPLLLAFVYYWMKRSLIPALAAIALLGSFYPQCALIAGGLAVARIGHYSAVKWRISILFQDCAQIGAVLGVLTLVLLPYLLSESAFGPVVTASEARTLEIFSPQGWSHFFDPNPWMFWFCGKRSGMLPNEWCKILINQDFLLLPPQIWLSLSLPLLMVFPQRLPLVRAVTPKISIILQWLLISLILFGLSHALIFDLHLPNRYTEHSLRIITAIMGGIALTIVLDGLIRCLAIPRLSIISAGCGLLIMVALFLYPMTLRNNNYFFKKGYVIGEFPRIYRFLQEQPKDILIASLVEEANSLPAFSQRSLFVGGGGYLLPYHWGYYHELTRRTVALIQAQYSRDWKTVTDFVDQYGIDFWLIDELAFTPDYLAKDDWLRQYPEELATVQQAIANDSVPVLLTVFDNCTVVKDKTLRLLDTSCVEVMSNKK